jgi:hypothetical protein
VVIGAARLKAVPFPVVPEVGVWRSAKALRHPKASADKAVLFLEAAYVALKRRSSTRGHWTARLKPRPFKSFPNQAKRRIGWGTQQHLCRLRIMKAKLAGEGARSTLKAARFMPLLPFVENVRK